MALRSWLLKHTVRAAKALGAKRSYSAARGGRLHSDWKAFNNSADEAIWMSLRVLRARSRSLARDDDYFKNYLRKLKTNVVGPKGMTMRIQAQLDITPVNAASTPLAQPAHGNSATIRNRKLNQTVEEAFAKWSKKKYASVNGKLSWRDLQNLCIETLAKDGEAVFRIIYGTNAFGFALQQIDVDWLDENYSVHSLPNGNNIVMSVEMDKYDRPVAYHFTPPRHSYYGVTRDHGLATSGQRVRVPAEEIIHVFDPDRAGQTRGVPYAHTAIGRLRQLDKYEEAELINARVSASKMGFIMPDVETLFEEGALDTDGDAQKRDPITDTVVPGMIQKLPAGWKFESFDPKSPTTVFASFCKQIIRGIAGGLGISYHSLANDLENVNYSSLRAGTLEDRDIYKGYQETMREHFCECVFEAWMMVANGCPFLKVSESDIETVLDRVRFMARGWGWVDPKDEATANQIEHDMGALPLTSILAERGADLEEVLETYKYERDLMASYGLDFTQVSNAANGSSKKDTNGSSGDNSKKGNGNSASGGSGPGSSNS